MDKERSNYTKCYCVKAEQNASDMPYVLCSAVASFFSALPTIVPTEKKRGFFLTMKIVQRHEYQAIKEHKMVMNLS